MKIFSVLESNPIGRAHDILEPRIDELKSQWDAKAREAKRPNITMLFSFLLGCSDDLIQKVELADIPSSDKKATVLRACKIILGYMLKLVLPIWLRPFGGRLVNFVIGVIFSYIIDWIVEKYRNGSWKEQNEQKETDTG